MSAPRVVLVHGYLANTSMLAVLAARLKRRGFAPSAWGYWNIRCSLLVHADRFARRLEQLDTDPGVDVFHLVTHSMGGIVARAALDRYRPRKLGRVVMLAPPNHGSFVATRAVGTFGRFLKPVAELSTAPDSLVNLLPMPRDLDLGVVAAEYDALVSEESTRPDVPHAFASLPTWHTGLLFSRETAELVSGFLATGRFPEPAIPRRSHSLAPLPPGQGRAEGARNPRPPVSDIARPMLTSPRPLGSSPVTVGPLGLGCWPLAGMTRQGISRDAAADAVRAAIDAGIAHFDTAYCYGEHGEADRAIAAALGTVSGPDSRGSRRDAVVIAGKCGIHWEPDSTAIPPRRLVVDGRPERLRAEVDESLSRLGTERFDLLYLHCPDPAVPIEDSAGELKRLRDAGKTRAVGLSNAGVDLLSRFAAECPLAACQMHFNMLQREIEDAVLPWCRERNVAMVVYWPLMKGLLAGKMHRGQVFPATDSRHKYPLFNGAEFERNLDFVAALRPVATRLGVTLTALVLAWTAEQPGITSVLFGATSPEQVEENTRALACTLDDAARESIRAAIAARGPVPRSRAT